MSHSSHPRVALRAAFRAAFRVAFRAALLLVAVLAVPGPAQSDGAPPPGTLEGRVVDATTGQPIYLVNITLDGTSMGTVSDREGHFALRRVPPGEYTVRIQHIGYALVLRPGIRVPYTGEALESRLTPRSIPLKEVTVTPGSFSFMDAGASARLTMSREDIQSVPQLGEDVFRAVNRLPGLSSGDYSAHFGIRGGRHDETLILMDGLEIYEPYHLKDFNEGAISIIDTETIEGVELLTGGFGAEYGNKRSGVFKISSRNPRLVKPRYSVGLSFMNARAMAMGSLSQGRGSWLVSARSGYMDLVFSLIKQNDLPSPRYQDLFAKLQWDFNERNTISFDVLYAGDRYDYDAAATTGFRDSLNTREFATNRYSNSYIWSSLVSSLSDKISVRNTLSAGLVSRNRDGYERYTDLTEPLYEIKNQRDFTVLGAKQDWTLEPAESFVFKAGVDVRSLDSKDRVESAVGQDPNDPTEFPPGSYPVVTQSSFDANGTRLGAYLSGRWRPVDPLILELGGRYDRASYTGDKDLSPRVNAVLRLGESRTLRAGWGYYRQMQGIDEVAALDDRQSFYPSELSEQWTAGLENRFENGAVLRIEGYYKDGRNLRPAYRNWKGGIDTFPETNEDRILVFPTTSVAKGIEFYYSRRFSERTSLRASYAFSRADEIVSRIDNVNEPDPPVFDREHAMPQDQRHAVNVDLTRQLGLAWALNASYSFHSGWPATLENLVQVTDGDGETDLAVRADKIYGNRLPTYQRLDARLTRRWSGERGDIRMFIELVNLTNHSNVFGFDYFKDVDASGDIQLIKDEETWFTILPSIGVSWSREF